MPYVTFIKCLSLTELLKHQRLLKKGGTVVQPTGQISFFLEWVKTKPNITDKKLIFLRFPFRTSVIKQTQAPQ